MIIQNIFLTKESYTHENWIYENIYTQFSRLYYILDGEAYYRIGETVVPLKKGHLYLTPVRKPFSLYENPNNKLLHTYAHITTIPAADHLIETEVKEDTCLYDAVALWRKYLTQENDAQMKSILQLVLSCLEPQNQAVSKIAAATKQLLDTTDTFHLTMEEIGRCVGYSKIHINRVFFDAYQMTPIRYLNNRRLNLGLQELLNGIPVTEISALLEYSSAAAFSKAFKLKFGLSPEKYLSTLQPSVVPFDLPQKKRLTWFRSRDSDRSR